MHYTTVFIHTYVRAVLGILVYCIVQIYSTLLECTEEYERHYLLALLTVQVLNAERIAILKAIKAIETSTPPAAANALTAREQPVARETLRVRATSVRQRARADGAPVEGNGLSVYNEGNADFTMHPDWPPTLHHHRTNPFGQYDSHDLHHRIEN